MKGIIGLPRIAAVVALAAAFGTVGFMTAFSAFWPVLGLVLSALLTVELIRLHRRLIESARSFSSERCRAYWG